MIPDLPLVTVYTCTHCDAPVTIYRHHDGAWGDCERCGTRYEVVVPVQTREGTHGVEVDEWH